MDLLLAGSSAKDCFLMYHPYNYHELEIGRSQAGPTGNDRSLSFATQNRESLYGTF